MHSLKLQQKRLVGHKKIKLLLVLLASIYSNDLYPKIQSLPLASAVLTTLFPMQLLSFLCIEEIKFSRARQNFVHILSEKGNSDIQCLFEKSKVEYFAKISKFSAVFKKVGIFHSLNLIQSSRIELRQVKKKSYFVT